MTTRKVPRPVTLAFAAMALAIVTLIAVNSVSRVRGFSPDSMNYLDVARNIRSGRGLTQSTLGFNQARFPADARIPAPFTAQAPAYPLLIALVSLAGLSTADAALVVPAVFFALCLLAAYLLARECYGEPVAMFAAALLMTYFPLRQAAGMAWSETIGIALVLGSLWLLARHRTRQDDSVSIVVAGALAGFAFATRYAFAVAGAVGVLALVGRRDLARTARSSLLFVLGFAGPVLPVLARNMIVANSWTGPAANPADTPWLTNVRASMWALYQYSSWYYAQPAAPYPQGYVLLASLAAAVAVLAARRTLRPALAGVLVRNGAAALVAWSIAYLVFLVYLRSTIWFDGIDTRLIAPAGAGLVIVWAGLAGATLAPRLLVVLPVLSLSLGSLALWREVRFFRAAPPAHDATPEISGRLQWIRERTTPRDLIIGDYTMDISYYVGDRPAIAFEHYPYTDKPDYEHLVAFLRHHCGEYRHAYLVVRDWHGADQRAWRKSFGPFVADAIAGRLDGYPRCVPVEKVSDAYVFELKQDDCGAPGSRPD